MRDESLKLLLLSIGTLVLVVVAGRFLTGSSWLLQAAMLIAIAVAIFFCGRGIGVALKKNSTRS